MKTNKTTKVLTMLGASLLSVVSMAQSTSSKKQAVASSSIIVTMADFNKALSEDTSVKTRAVTFKKLNLKLAGMLYLPSDLDESKKYRAIVVVHPGGGIKEQTAGLYAYRLAQQGYVALAFDAAYQGASEGQPRGLEDPTSRVEDVRSAVDYISSLSFVDQNKIGALGICAGGGYAVGATITEHRIKAVATVSAVDIGAGFRQGWRNTESVATQIKTLEAVAKQRSAEANGSEAMLIPYVPDTTDKVTEPDMIEASEYYRLSNRWLHPNSTNRLLFSSIDKIYAFSAFDRIGTLLTQPLLMIAGSEAGSKWHSEQGVKLAKGPKELFIVKGGTHMSLYDKDVVKTMPKIIEFFSKNIK
ncbi:alpha/beta hydrolase [Bdellovibrio bacteriovorus]|uniref:Alpha/beta hydrolase superfamily protein n=1 Tax=Bdellovibrio bacteriovorus str. Tiberius TaxID=1069642 RepID=K7ZGI3_BDEBC|nr:alpha/beta hydrolase [Bdellovibrio bacteriovorus]AFY02517.1 alpha/beta hydrolase superfamily protein [Bdellovibrio bacteriovorus str. Tiberius]